LVNFLMFYALGKSLCFSLKSREAIHDWMDPEKGTSPFLRRRRRNANQRADMFFLCRITSV